MQNQEKLTQDLIGLEKKYWQAMIDQDLDAAVALTDFPCLVAGEHGFRSVDKAEFKKMFNSHQETIKDLNIDDDSEVRFLNENTAIIAYKIHCVVEINGADHEINAVDTSTWINRNGKWTCALHTETKVLN